LRQAALSRDAYLCQPCANADRITTATQVDHIKPKAEGGTDDLDNLQAICADCHADKTAAESAKARGTTAKPRIRFDSRGFPVW